ncbi:MAG: DUF4920 domain-containing protein [Planctomycetota bacterium]|nr:MAG: DUF4920 domain-containing protein [Planctomycetota bacterium]
MKSPLFAWVVCALALASCSDQEGGQAAAGDSPAPSSLTAGEAAPMAGGCVDSEESVCDSQATAPSDGTDAAAAAAPAAGDPAPPPADETAYGAPLTLDTITPIADLVADWEKYEGRKVQVRGTVVAVCEHRGCWMDIAGGEDYQKVRFKVNDGEMVFPITAKGATATAEGVVTKIVVPVERLREVYAARAEAAGEEFDPASITEPQVIWQIQGTGARIGL